MTPALEAAAHAFARDYWNNWANDALFGTLNKGIGEEQLRKEQAVLDRGGLHVGGGGGS
jgi:hypothetical protein